MPTDMTGQTLVALTLQPDDDTDAASHTPSNEGDILIAVALTAIVAVVFCFDMIRTWWETNQWRRDARRRRRELR